jgi:YHS domain-containing protein
VKGILFAGIGLSLVLAATAAFSESKVDSKAKLLCPVSGKPVDKSVSSDFGGGKILFCCTKCKAKFDADNSKFTTKANLQLAASGQAKQTVCPFSGAALKASTAVNVAGVDVQFCCNNCKAKVAAAKPEQQIQMIFDSKPFSRAFKVTKD